MPEEKAPDNSTYWSQIDAMCFELVKGIADCSMEPIPLDALNERIPGIAALIRNYITTALSESPCNGKFPANK